MSCTTCEDERVYWTATGMVFALETSRTLADMTAELSLPERTLERQGWL